MSSALGKRIGAVVDRSRTEEGNARTLLLPLDLMRDYLSDHPLVLCLGTPVDEVHAAFLAFHAHVQRQRAACAQPRQPTQPTTHSSGDCLHCGRGHLLLDHHGGVHVCSHCGVVSTLRTLNVQPEYTGPTEADKLEAARGHRHRAKHGGHKLGFPKHMLFHSQRECDYERPSSSSSYWQELQHWNQFTHLSEESLEEVDVYLSSWVGGTHTRDAKLAAALFYPLLRDRVPTAEALRRSLRDRSSALPTVVDPTPVPQHACQTCGHMEHTEKGARFHCLWANKTRKRPRRL